MADNHPDDKYFYEITVETGPWASHATTSKISFILYGMEEESNVRQFNDPTRKIFKSGGVDSFLMSVPRPLGDLQFLRIWTDSSGLGEMSAWYLLGITIHDVQTGIITRFLPNQWLAIDRGTFEDELRIPAKDEDEPLDFRYKFYSYATQSMKDDHLWWSIFSRPVQSRFSRKERVSVSYALIFLTIVTNGMFYNQQQETAINPFYSLGFLRIDIVDVRTFESLYNAAFLT